MERVLLGKMIRIATLAHDGQLDKAGFPYILHVLRVMMSVGTIKQKIIACGHDLFEDTTVTALDLAKEGFTASYIYAIELLTKEKGVDYSSGSENLMKYLERIKQNEDARKVKIADMKDNANILRFHEIESKHVKMIMKYHAGIKFLEPDFNEKLEI